MKRILSLLMLAVMAFSFVACGDDDSNNLGKEEKIVSAKKYSFAILVNGQQTKEQEVKLKDFSEIAEKTAYVRKASVKIKTSDLQIVGLKDGTVLKSLKLAVKENTNIVREYTDVKVDQVFDLGEDLDFIKNLMDKLVEKKSLTLIMSVESDEVVSDVKLHLNIDCEFTLN